MEGSDDVQTLHGSALLVGAKGVLLLGESGSGKSTLAHALIAYAQTERMFARWVGDDQLRVQRAGSALMVHAVQNIAGKAEQPFNGIVKIEHVPSARIDLLVHLRDETELERIPEKVTDMSFPEIGALLVPRRSTAISVPLIVKQLNI